MQDLKVIFVVAVFVGGLSTAAVAQDAQNCTLTRYTKAQLTTLPDGRVTVPATINGWSANLLVDTGGGVSVLTEPFVANAGLRKVPSGRGHIVLYGGSTFDEITTVPRFRLGEMAMHARAFFVMPGFAGLRDVQGLIGADALSEYDVEFDFADNTLSVLSQSHCRGRVVYWTRDVYAQIPFGMDQDHHIDIPVRLDGKSMFAQIDTGAARSVGSLDDLKIEFRIDDSDAALKPLAGSNSPERTYPFKNLSLGGVTVTNPNIVLVPDEEANMGRARSELIIGMNVLRHLHIYISYGEGVLYITSASAH